MTCEEIKQERSGLDREQYWNHRVMIGSSLGRGGSFIRSGTGGLNPSCSKRASTVILVIVINDDMNCR